MNKWNNIRRLLPRRTEQIHKSVIKAIGLPLKSYIRNKTYAPVCIFLDKTSNRINIASSHRPTLYSPFIIGHRK